MMSPALVPIHRRSFIDFKVVIAKLDDLSFEIFPQSDEFMLAKNEKNICYFDL